MDSASAPQSQSSSAVLGPKADLQSSTAIPIPIRAPVSVDEEEEHFNEFEENEDEEEDDEFFDTATVNAEVGSPVNNISSNSNSFVNGAGLAPPPPPPPRVSVNLSDDDEDDVGVSSESEEDAPLVRIRSGDGLEDLEDGDRIEDFGVAKVPSFAAMYSDKGNGVGGSSGDVAVGNAESGNNFDEKDRVFGMQPSFEKREDFGTENDDKKGMGVGTENNEKDASTEKREDFVTQSDVKEQREDHGAAIDVKDERNDVHIEKNGRLDKEDDLSENKKEETEAHENGELDEKEATQSSGELEEKQASQSNGELEEKEASPEKIEERTSSGAKVEPIEPQDSVSAGEKVEPVEPQDSVSAREKVVPVEPQDSVSDDDGLKKEEKGAVLELNKEENSYNDNMKKEEKDTVMELNKEENSDNGNMKKEEKDAVLELNREENSDNDNMKKEEKDAFLDADKEENEDVSKGVKLEKPEQDEKDNFEVESSKDSSQAQKTDPDIQKEGIENSVVERDSDRIAEKAFDSNVVVERDSDRSAEKAVDSNEDENSKQEEMVSVVENNDEIQSIEKAFDSNEEEVGSIENNVVEREGIQTSVKAFDTNDDDHTKQEEEVSGKKKDSSEIEKTAENDKVDAGVEENKKEVASIEENNKEVASIDKPISETENKTRESENSLASFGTSKGEFLESDNSATEEVVSDTGNDRNEDANMLSELKQSVAEEGNVKEVSLADRNDDDADKVATATVPDVTVPDVVIESVAEEESKHVAKPDAEIKTVDEEKETFDKPNSEEKDSIESKKSFEGNYESKSQDADTVNSATVDSDGAIDISSGVPLQVVEPASSRMISLEEAIYGENRGELEKRLTFFEDLNEEEKNVIKQETVASVGEPPLRFDSSSFPEDNRSILERMVQEWEHRNDEEEEDGLQDDEEDDDDDDEGEIVDPSAIAALMEAASSAEVASRYPNFSSSASFPSRPVGLGTSLDPIPRPIRRSTALTEESNADDNSGEELDETEKKLRALRVNFLRLVNRLGQSPQNPVVTQVLYRLGLAEGLKRGRNNDRGFNLEKASRIAENLESEGKEELDFTCNILVLGKTGVGKSATINSLFNEIKSETNAFGPGTTKVKEIVGTIQGINVRVIDTPGLTTSFHDQRKNRKIMASVKSFIGKRAPDIVLYFDRLDWQSRDYSDLSLLKIVTETLGASIWFNAIIVLTHASSSPPDGANGMPMSYDIFMAQRTHIVQQYIRQAAGDLRLLNPVSLVENHPACSRNANGESVLPNGQVWKQQLLLLCFASKVLTEANALLKFQDNTPGKPFTFRTRAPPLPYLLNSLLQSRPPPKLPHEQLNEDMESDDDLDRVSDAESDDEFDSLPPFRHLSKEELSMLDKKQRTAYYKEIDQREKLFMKKQLKEEARRRKHFKSNKAAYEAEEANAENEDPPSLPMPMPDFTLPMSFDADNPSYRYRGLDSQFLIRPVLDSHGWDHDVGYDGVNFENTFAVKKKIPVQVSGQITKDKKDANLQFEGAASLKHKEHIISQAAIDVRSAGRDLSYTLRGDTRFDNFKSNKTTVGLEMTRIGETLAYGVKMEDRLMVGKKVKVVATGGSMMGNKHKVYGGCLDVSLNRDYPLGQPIATAGLILMHWHGDLSLSGNVQNQINVGRKDTVVARAALNNRGSGQLTIRLSSNEHLQLALVGLIPIVRNLLHRFGLDSSGAE